MRLHLWQVVCVAVCATACDPEPVDHAFLALGPDVHVNELERGSYRSTNPKVLTLLESTDTSSSGCSGVALFGCGSDSITIEGTLIKFQTLAPGEASIRGKTAEGREISLDYTIEAVTGLQVRRVTTPSDNHSPEVEVAADEELTVSPAAQLVLQVYLLGKSRAALGSLDAFEVSSADESVASVDYGGYSRGYRARLKAVAAGDTTITLSTPAVSRTLSVRVTD